MIKLKNILLESPDMLYFRDADEKYVKTLHWEQNDAFPFYFLKNKMYVGTGGQSHYQMVSENIKDYYELFKTIRPVTWITDDESPEDVEYALDNPEEELDVLIQIVNAIYRYLKKEIHGRYWKLGGEWGGVKNPQIISFWKYPSNKSELLKMVRMLKLNPKNTFIDIKTTEWLKSYNPIPIEHYTKPDVEYVPPFRHDLAPHLR